MELLLSQFQLHGIKTELKVHINQNSSYHNSVADFKHTFASTFSLMCDKCWSSLSSASNCLKVIRNNRFIILKGKATFKHEVEQLIRNVIPSEGYLLQCIMAIWVLLDYFC